MDREAGDVSNLTRGLALFSAVWKIFPLVVGIVFTLVWLEWPNCQGSCNPSFHFGDDFGLVGIALIASGLSLLLVLQWFGPMVRRPGFSILKFPRYWGRRQIIASAFILVICSGTFNTVSGYFNRPQQSYDEQIGITFADNLTRMDVNVSAVEQTGPDGNGAAYLLNGLSDTSYWYQAGLSWYWDGPRLGCDAGFAVIYAVFAPDGAEVLPSGSGTVLTSLNVHEGDRVLLSMYFSRGDVVMGARDWNTGSSSEQDYPARGGTYFRGLQQQSLNGSFTGLMTEQFHDNYYYGGEQRVVYSWSSPTKTSAVMWTDEYAGSNANQTIFSQSLYVSYDLTKTWYSSIDGAYELSTQNELVTGQLQVDPPTQRWVCAVLSIF